MEGSESYGTCADEGCPCTKQSCDGWRLVTADESEREVTAYQFMIGWKDCPRWDVYIGDNLIIFMAVGVTAVTIHTRRDGSIARAGEHAHDTPEAAIECSEEKASGLMDDFPTAEGYAYQ